jgi:hypothetical protein
VGDVYPTAIFYLISPFYLVTVSLLSFFLLVFHKKSKESYGKQN